MKNLSNHFTSSLKVKKYVQAFSQGKSAWASTLKSNAQSRGVLGKTSQNKK